MSRGLKFFQKDDGFMLSEFAFIDKALAYTLKNKAGTWLDILE